MFSNELGFPVQLFEIGYWRVVVFGVWSAIFAVLAMLLYIVARARQQYWAWSRRRDDRIPNDRFYIVLLESAIVGAVFGAVFNDLFNQAAFCGLIWFLDPMMAKHIGFGNLIHYFAGAGKCVWFYH